MINNEVIVGIINHKHDENALKWYNRCKNIWNTYLIDTYHVENPNDKYEPFEQIKSDKHFLLKENIFYGGCIQILYNLSKENEDTKWMLYLGSDVEIDDENFNKLVEIVNNEITKTYEISSYQPSLIEGSFGYSTATINEYNKHLYNQHTNGLREVKIGEDWFHLVRIDIVSTIIKHYVYEENMWGYHLASCFNYMGQSKGLKCVIDDRVNVFHPSSKAITLDARAPFINQGVKFFKKCTDMKLFDKKYHFVTNEIDTYFNKDENNKDKYIVCTCAKNEDEYIVEFIEHYLKIGFDKIIICDNNDKNTLLNVIRKYVEDGTVEIFNCWGFNSFQVQFYSMFCEEGYYKWCAYFDVDEFLELSPKYNNIKEFLDTINEDCVCFNWLTFGSNGQLSKTEGGVQERFTKPISPILYRKENMFIKSIVKGGYGRFEKCWFNGSHIPTTKNKNIKYNIGGYFVTNETTNNFFPPRYKNGYLKHYYTKSFDEWCHKAERGWPDGTTNLRLKDYFICNNNTNVMPINYFHNSLFDWNLICNNSIINDYSTINFQSKQNSMYNYTLYLFAYMDNTKGHTFILSGDIVDDYFYNMALEYGFLSDNFICFADTDDERWTIFVNRNFENKGTYYILFV